MRKFAVSDHVLDSHYQTTYMLYQYGKEKIGVDLRTTAEMVNIDLLSRTLST